jgi:hypothetical protein
MVVNRISVHLQSIENLADLCAEYLLGPVKLFVSFLKEVTCSSLRQFMATDRMASAEDGLMIQPLDETKYCGLLQWLNEEEHPQERYEVFIQWIRVHRVPPEQLELTFYQVSDALRAWLQPL